MTAWSKSRRAERRAGGIRRGPSRLALGVALATLLVAGCAVFGTGVDRFTEGVGYYWQTVAGHLSILQRAEPVGDLLADGRLDPRTRERLELARQIRRFAVSDLGLPDNGSYTRFADLKQPFVTWGVVAAPELSLRLTQWCFPVAGCVTYRGYYSLEAAEHYAAKLQSQGLDVQINGVPAYSTLGWLDDPLLSTFINYPDAELARLVFHELSHQVVYVPGDSMFNESFASTVDVPVSVVLTTRDRLVRPRKQRALAKATGAIVFELDGDHDVCWLDGDGFAKSTRDALQSVLERA